MNEDRVYESGPGWNSVTFKLPEPRDRQGEDIHPDARLLLRALGFVAGAMVWDQHGQCYRQESGPEQINRAREVEIPKILRRLIELEQLNITLDESILRLRRELTQYANALDAQLLVDQQLREQIERQKGKTPPAIGPRAFFDEG